MSHLRSGSGSLLLVRKDNINNKRTSQEFTTNDAKGNTMKTSASNNQQQNTPLPCKQTNASSHAQTWELKTQHRKYGKCTPLKQNNTASNTEEQHSYPELLRRHKPMNPWSYLSSFVRSLEKINAQPQTQDTTYQRRRQRRSGGPHN